MKIVILSKYFRHISVMLVGLILITFINACNGGSFYQAGSGVGSVGEVKEQKYKTIYLKRYADSFLIKYPNYKLPKDVHGSNIASNYDFLNMTTFYFDTLPREVYHVDWGTMSIRFAYNLDSNKEIYENPRGDIEISKQQRDRITERFKTEILDKIDSLIFNSKDRDSAIIKINNK